MLVSGKSTEACTLQSLHQTKSTDAYISICLVVLCEEDALVIGKENEDKEAGAKCVV